MLKNLVSLFKFAIADLINMFLKFTTSKTVAHKKTTNSKKRLTNVHNSNKQISTNSFDEFILICDHKFDCHLLTKFNIKFNQKI